MCDDSLDDLFADCCGTGTLDTACLSKALGQGIHTAAVDGQERLPAGYIALAHHSSSIEPRYLKGIAWHSGKALFDTVAYL